MNILFFYLKKHWKAVDEWLFYNFDFGLIELGEVAEKLLIDLTQ